MLLCGTLAAACFRAAIGLTLTVGTASAPAPPPTSVDWDYQLGGVRSVPGRVGIVERDRRAQPLPGSYAVCYVNGFQTQPDERRFWRDPDRWSLVLKDRRGRPVVDSAWGEWLLDLRTDTRRRRLAQVVGRWIDGCAASGFDAVELDNLDSWTRSHRLLTSWQARALARLLVARAHRAGLAAAQKNWPSLDGRTLGYDFAVAEECGRYRECAAYVGHYGRRVLAVEYRDADFAWACRHVGARLPVLRRDRDLGARGVRRWC